MLDERAANTATEAGSRPPRLLAGLLIAAFAAGYVAQVATPLRLNVDSLTYLKVAISAMNGEGFLDGSSPSQFPPGYPALVAVLGLMGLGSPFWIVLVNVVSVGLGCFIAHQVLTRSGLLPSDQSVWIVVATLGSFAVIKHVTLPMAESVFFLLTMLFAWSCIVAVRQLTVRRQGCWGGLCVLLAASAFLTRSVAVVFLLPLVMLPLVGRNVTGEAKSFLIRHPIRSASLIALGVVIAAGVWWWILGTTYYADLHRVVGRWGPGRYLSLSLFLTLQELGEIGLNGPAGRLAGQSPFFELVIRILGGILLALSIIGVGTRRRAWGPLEMLFASYVALMFVWLSVDARFWIPILPLLFAYAWLGLRGLFSRWAQPLGTIYLVGFLAMSAVSMGYSTRLSWMSPQDFNLHYGDQSLNPGYEAARIGGAREDLDGMNRRVYDVLLHFGRADQARPPNPAAAPIGDLGLD